MSWGTAVALMHFQLEDYCECVGVAEHMSSVGLRDVGQSCRHSKVDGRVSGCVRRAASEK